MKKSEFIQKIIDIEKERGENTNVTISMNYIKYLEKMKKLVEIGDIEIE